MTNRYLDELISSDPSLAALYLICIENPIANMDDVSLVLSSLPSGFAKESIIKLYLFAEKAKQSWIEKDPQIEADIEVAQESLRDIPTRASLDSFRPNFNHNLSEIVRHKIKSDFGFELGSDSDSSFFSQYGEAKLFENKIILQKEEATQAYKEIAEESAIHRQQNEQSLGRFALDEQSAHSLPGEIESVDRLKASYPGCNIEKNILDIEKYINKIPDEKVSSSNRNKALSLLRQTKINSEYAPVRERLAYVWEAIKVGDKLTGENTRGVPLEILQQNLKETLVQQIASAERNYSVEGKAYDNAGRSCPSGTKNIILDVLSKYHSDVSFGYGFTNGRNSLLNFELAPVRFKELFLEQMDKEAVER